MMRWLFALLFLFNLPLRTLPLPAAPSASGQSTPELLPLDVQSKFGEQITFSVMVQPASSVKELVVFITPEGQITGWQKIPLNDPQKQNIFSVTIQAGQLTLFPFSQISYYFKATLTDETQVSSPAKSFVYADNRFQWKELKSGPFQIQWNSDDDTLGQEIANVAQEGLQKAQQLITSELPGVLRIYAYTSSQDLQTALQLTNQPWVAGHTTPELNMIMISVPSGPEKSLELRRQIPHEIMHILQYQVMGENYQRQPIWLVEGMASQAELAENPEYRTVLKAIQPGQVISFRTICLMFPREAGSAFQSYAQSESFVSFLQQKFGSAKLMDLIKEYNTGVGCEEGVLHVLGFSLNQLEYRWEQEVLGINVGGLAFSNLLPYLLLGLFILIPAALVFVPIRFRRSDEEDEQV
jgi:hypothetical protein